MYRAIKSIIVIISVVMAIIMIDISCAAQTISPPVFNPTPNNVLQQHPLQHYAIQKTAVEKASRKHRFLVEFTDGKVDTLYGKIDEHEGSYYLSVERPISRAIRPKETLVVTRFDADFKIYKGTTLDSTCWAFCIARGPINLYSFLPEDDGSFAMMIQKGSDQPVELNKENMMRLLENRSKKVTSLIDDNKLDKAVKVYNMEQQSRK